VSDHSRRRPSTPILGESWLDIVDTVDERTVISCSVCRAIELFEATDEPLLQHASECPVSRAVREAFQIFLNTSGSAWLA
jgi:hypothetical protein